MRQWQAIALAAALGATSVLGYAPFALPSAVLPAPTFTLAALLWLAARGDGGTRTGAWLGGAYGLGCFLAGVSWIYISLAQFSGLPAPAAALATLALCLYLALFPALALALWMRWRSGTARLRDATLFAALWTLCEWIRGTLFTGFPWLATGYAYTPPSPLAGYASTLGIYGVGFFAALLAGVLVTLVGGQTRQRIAAASLVALLLGTGALLGAMRWTEPVGAPVRVSLLQGDVPQSLKWDPARLQLSFDRYLALAERANAPPIDLLVLPETALPLLFEALPDEVLTRLAARSDVLLGAAASIAPRSYVNAALALPQGARGTPQLYAKQHLVPFGEYAPPGFRWFFDQLRIPMSDFTAGTLPQPPLIAGGARIAPNICYEDIFGEELLPALRESDLLVNLSNTAWFGDSLAQPQHLQMARMRALETGRTMLRATNSGMTAMIGPDGYVTAQLPPFSIGRLDVAAQRYTGLTPYAKWGNTLILICCLVTCGIALLRGRRPATRAI
jgi:apolipoprotein N-acyltransferase